jgi:hypothetical protein
MSKIVFAAATVQGGRLEGVEARLYEEQIGDFPLGLIEGIAERTPNFRAS